MGHRNLDRAIQSVHAVIESLPKRMLLSVSLTGKAVSIVGTESNDKIYVAADKQFLNVFDVDVNGELTRISYSAASKVNITGLGGDDRIIVDSSLDAANLSAVIDGGTGNDRITTSAAADRIHGGDGDDTISSGAGSDWLFGDAGNDLLNGEGGGDKIIGGAGNDKINGGTGDDTLSDSAGRDLVHAGPGNDHGTFTDDGNIYGDAGGDQLTSTGGAYVYGGADDDTLVGQVVWGGDGNDLITGTARSDTIHGDDGADTIHGGDGNDLLFGDDGADLIYGEGGGDALYGGSMSDTLHGGDGNDNLYADDGPKDKSPAADDGDFGYGEGGKDWFEPTKKWAFTDADAKTDSNAQTKLGQDPSYGSYSSGSFMTINSGSWNGGMTSIAIGDQNFDGRIGSVSVPELKSLGDAGWLAMGTYDASTKQIVPSMLSTSQRKAVKPTILQLPPTWKLGAMTTAKDGIIWYRVTGETINATPPTASPFGNLGTSGSVQFIDGQWVQATSSTVNPTGTGTESTVPATTSSDPIATAPDSTKGVDSYYRYLAVKRGTILVGSSDDPNSPLSSPLNSSFLALPGRGEARIAGSNDVHQLGRIFTTSPSDAPDNARGLLLQDGAIWIPNDGSSPFFAAD